MRICGQTSASIAGSSKFCVIATVQSRLRTQWCQPCARQAHRVLSGMRRALAAQREDGRACFVTTHSARHLRHVDRVAGLLHRLDHPELRRATRPHEVGVGVLPPVRGRLPHLLR